MRARQILSDSRGPAKDLVIKADATPEGGQ